MELTPAILAACMPLAPRGACEVYAPAIQAAAVEFGLTDPNRLAAALASGANESGQLHKFEEMTWFNTDWERARGMFAHCPSRADYEAWRALGQAEFDRRFFDAVYGPMMGNKGQGYKYRGLGWGQLTGHDNDKQVGEAIGVDLVANPELMRDDPAIGTRAFFAYLKINRITDPAVNGTEAGFLESVRRSNPGLDPAIFRSHHLQRWREVRKGLGITGGGLDVAAMQRALNAEYARATLTPSISYRPLDDDGLMGPKTAERLRWFQNRKHLPVTGEPDATTLAALGMKAAA